MSQVETYFVEESQSLICDSEELDKWRGLVEELALTGQQKLGEPEKSPCSFRPMSVQEERVYKTLFEKEIEISSFSAEIIPTRALAAVALAQKEGYFNKGIYVMYSEEERDPVIIGRRAPDSSRSWDFKTYLIARFGDSLKSFEELTSLAVKKRASNILADVSEALNRLKDVEASPEKYAKSYLLGNNLRSVYINF